MGDGPHDRVEIPSGRVARGTVAAPPSKSHAIRALVCAALSGNGAYVQATRGPWPDDVVRTAAALRALGVCIDAATPTVLEVGGTGGRLPREAATLDVGGSATALRILAAVCALGPGPYTVTGSAQLLQRPAGSVVPALRALGVSVKGACGGSEGVRPPLVVSGGPPRGGEVVVDASSSSQAVSALLLIAPLVPGGLTVRLRGAPASEAYVALTLQTMASFRVLPAPVVVADGWAFEPAAYVGDGHAVEGDWSCASYLLAAGAVTRGDVRVTGLRADSVQPDRRIVEFLAAFGAPDSVSKPIDVDLGDAPDLAPLVGALGCLVPGTTRVRGAAHLRIKETDRIAEVCRCARALGCEARELPDGFEITGPATRGADLDPAGDHRLAMAFAVAGLAVPGVRILDPGCVAKSYPAFWDDLLALL